MIDTLPIVAATVHPDGAVVERAGPVRIRGGRAEITGLPLALDRASIRCSVDSGRILAIDVGLELARALIGPAPAVEAALLDAVAALQRIDAEVQVLQAQRQRLAELLPSFDEAPEDATLTAEGVARVLALDAPLSSWCAEIDASLRRLARRREDAEEEVQIRQHLFYEASSEQRFAHWLPTLSARLEIEAEGDTVPCRLSYRVEAARWSPAYALHADGALRRGRLVQKALVAQATGEDWNGIRMALSTVPSQRVTGLPELPALRLGTAQPPRPPAWRPLPADLEELFPAEVRPAPPKPRPQPMRRKKAERRERETAEEEFAKSEVTIEFAEDVSTARPGAPRQSLPPPFHPSAASAAPAAPPQPVAASADAPPRSAPGLVAGMAKMARMAIPAPMAPSASVSAQESGYGGSADLELSLAPPTVKPLSLSYGRMRLLGAESPIGKRGRLEEMDLADEARARLPLAALDAVASQVADSQARAGAMRQEKLPPHHHLPGPIQGIDVRIEAGAPVDVPSTGRFTAVSLTSQPLELKVRYRSVPRMDTRVYRQLEASVPQQTPMLPGPVDIYVDGALEVSTPWAGSAGAAKLLVDMGAEDRLRLVRNVRYREESAGLLGAGRRLYTDIEVEVASGLGSDAEVDLYERIPIAGDDAVTIEEGAANPAAQSYEGEPGSYLLEGGRRQRLLVSAGGLGKATLSYAAWMKKKIEIQGGDRRG